MYQLKLLFEHNKVTLKDYLENVTGKTITLSITDNTASMLSVKEKHNSETFLRLHWMFLHAGNEVCREIAAFIRNRKCNTPSIGKFIRDNKDCIRKSVRTCALNVQGRYYNLKEMFDLINRRYFNDRIRASITWGKKRSRWYKGKRTLGSYDENTNLIRINPLLDQRSVPRYFVEFVVYHEMLHADMLLKKDGMRSPVHSKEFKKREILFEKYKNAVKWEKNHLG